jgi:hypothetical protein
VLSSAGHGNRLAVEAETSAAVAEVGSEASAHDEVVVGVDLDQPVRQDGEAGEKPDPAMALSGVFSLKKKGVPTGRLTARVDGRREVGVLASRILREVLVQPGSVMATKASPSVLTAARSEAVSGDPARRAAASCNRRPNFSEWLLHLHDWIDHPGVLEGGRWGAAPGGRAWTFLT